MPSALVLFTVIIGVNFFPSCFDFLNYVLLSTIIYPSFLGFHTKYKLMGQHSNILRCTVICRNQKVKPYSFYITA